jgi:hypothetical protein
MNLMGPKGRAIYIATPWHTEDLTSALEGNSEWNLWKKPAINPYKVSVPKGVEAPVLWKARWHLQALMKRKASIGERAFSRQFLLEPLSDAEKTFSALAFNLIMNDKTYPGAIDPDTVRAFFHQEATAAWPIQRGWGWPIVAGVDLASSLNMKAAWNVIIVAAISPDMRRWVMGVERWKGKFPETIQRLIRVWNYFRPILTMVENNGYQQSVVDQMGETARDMPIMGWRTGNQKWDEAVGLPGLNIQMEKGLWVLGRDGDHSHAMVDDELVTFCSECALVDEIRLHPQGAFQDTVMALWFTEAAARIITAQADPEQSGGYYKATTSSTPLWSGRPNR